MNIEVINEKFFNHTTRKLYINNVLIAIYCDTLKKKEMKGDSIIDEAQFQSFLVERNIKQFVVDNLIITYTTF